MLKLGELVAYLRADDKQLEQGLDEGKRKFRRAGADMERDATTTGQAMGAGLGSGGAGGGERFTRDATGRLRDSHGRFAAAGALLGEGLGDGFTRGADGRLRDARGRFVREAEQMGQAAGGAASGGLASLKKRLDDVMSGASSVLTNVWNLVPVIIGLGAAATFAGPAVGILGGALGSLPALATGAGAGIGVMILGSLGLADAFKKTSSAGGAVVDKAWQIAQAERRVRDANLEVLAATEALSRARETAAERIDDLNRSITGAHLDEESAVLAVADAEKALADARRTGTADDVKKADLALRQQKNTLDDIRERLGDMEQEQKRNAQQGVEGSDEVRSAYDRQRKAVEGVTDAEHSLAEARKPAPGGGGAADDAIKLAASAQAVVNVIKALKPAWDDLRLDVQQRLFAGVAGEIRSLSDAWLPTLHDKLGQTADSYNRLIKIFSGEIRKPEFIENISEGLDAVDRLVDKVGGAIAGPFVDAWGRLSAAASPFLDAVGDEVAGLVEDFAAWIKSADESGALKDFFDKAGGFFRDAVDMGRDAGGILGEIAAIAFGKQSQGESPWEALKNDLHDLRLWFEDPENQKKVQDWIDKLERGGRTVLIVAGWIGDLILWLDRADRTLHDWAAGIAKWATKDVPEALNQLTGWFGGLPGRISAVAGGMFDGIRNSFRSALNFIIGGWNNLRFTVGGGSIMGQNIPSMTLNTPDIPYLADGGIVRATPGGRLVGVAEGGKDEVVAPLDKLAAMLGGGRGGGMTRVVAETDDDLLSLLFRSIRWKVKGEYGGDVDAAFAGV